MPVKSKSLKAQPKKIDKVQTKIPVLPLVHKLPDEVQQLITWKPGTPTPYNFIVSMFLKVEAETKRNVIINIVRDYILAISCTTPQDVIPFSFMCIGELRPTMEGVKLDIGESLIIEALASSTGRTTDQIKIDYTSGGDLSKIAKSSKAKQGRIDLMFGKTEERLTIQGVYKSFLEIAQTQGSNSRRNKIGKVAKLITSTKDDEVKFIIRSLGGSLSIGFAASTLLIAIGRAFLLRDYYLGKMDKFPTEDDLLTAGKEFKKVFHSSPLLDKLLEFLLENDFAQLEEKCGCQVGIPIMPMLAKPAKSTQEIRRRLGTDLITCEYKYDGERAQIHKTKDGKIRIFSRNTNDITEQFGDLIPIFQNNVNAEDFVLDSEIVAYDTEKDIILPFQTLMHRARKGDSTNEPSPIHVCCFTFDCMYCNGKSLISKTFDERRQTLHEIVQPVQHLLQFANYLNTDLDNMADFFNEAVKNRTEGLMIKTRTGPYEPGKRSQLWAKLKKDYVQGIGTSEETSKISDCVDVVVIGGTYGKGKRAGLIGCYLVAIWNEEIGKFQAICEVGTGFSDDDLKDFTEKFKEMVVTKPPPEVQYGKNTPDVYYKPEVVWEIGAADLTISPKAMACYGDVHGQENAGISLRFGRFLRFRDDKTPRQATNSHQILDMYFEQSNRNE